MSFKRNLRIIFDETTTTPHLQTLGGNRRYVAKAFSSAGPGWGIYDRKAERFLKDSEVGKLSLEAIRQPLSLN